MKPQEQAAAKKMVVVESEHLHADPGYLSTSRLVLEAGLCLALQVSLCTHVEGVTHKRGSSDASCDRDWGLIKLIP